MRPWSYRRRRRAPRSEGELALLVLPSAYHLVALYRAAQRSLPSVFVRRRLDHAVAKCPGQLHLPELAAHLIAALVEMKYEISHAGQLAVGHLPVTGDPRL